MKTVNLNKEFNDKSYNDNMSEISTFFQNISIEDNMGCQVVEISDISSGEIIVKHDLKVVPKYRIILRQTDGGLITDNDGQTPWDASKISLYNNGTTIRRLIIAIFRS